MIRILIPLFLITVACNNISSSSTGNISNANVDSVECKASFYRVPNLISEGKYDTAEAVLNAYLEFECVQKDSVFFRFAHLFFDQQEYIIAKNYLDEAIRINASVPDYYYNRAICLNIMKQNKLACDDLEYILFEMKKESDEIRSYYNQICD